jgi:hypothetical protein
MAAASLACGSINLVRLFWLRKGCVIFLPGVERQMNHPIRYGSGRAGYKASSSLVSSRTRCFEAMLRRIQLTATIAMIFGLPFLVHGSQIALNAHASEAVAAPKPLQLTAETLESDRIRITQWLARDGFTLSGDIRLRGQLVTVSAQRKGAPWLLVLDAATGEIIGRRPLAQSANTSD